MFSVVWNSVYFMVLFFSVMKRWELQGIFTELNPDFSEQGVEIAPDGDVLLSDQQVERFQVKHSVAEAV